MTDPETRLSALQHRIEHSCRSAGRDPAEVTLLAVSKTRDAAAIRALHGAGAHHFGENYLQEALAKQPALADLPLTWHFIGPIQSNKTRDIAAHFDWVHSVDREKIARRLSDQRPEHLPPLNLCLQVNIDTEASKQGVSLAELPALAEAVATLPRVRLRGLMAIPRADAPDNNRAAFRTLAMTLSQLRHTMTSLDTLSMGMSDDFETAIAEGATLVRLGTALFGPRD
ncbi:YggS family pyridoxal phosphate-dependent enzyme [Isoalcanivorax indicus]|uniref:YggS family pyridoxal phosphate-dependent enzyme n=1 Tax=Isoalcanivorax indicus TaxID=2202653 RepID=UPI000DB9E0FE|nr:YggS family pyridoxal phosphate-dependent enzyme [Isoalcanivorax indicus]